MRRSKLRCVPLPSPSPTDLTRSAQSDWEESSDEEDKPAAPAPVAPPKKKGNLKQKLAEKEAAKAARKAAGEDDVGYDSDEVLDPREKARLDKERELNSDLNNAADLFGAAALGGMSFHIFRFYNHGHSIITSPPQALPPKSSTPSSPTNRERRKTSKSCPP